MEMNFYRIAPYMNLDIIKKNVFYPPFPFLPSFLNKQG